jgi:hypothetical protein
VKIFKHPKHAIQAEPIDDDATNNTKHCDYLLCCYVTMIYAQRILNSGTIGNIGQIGPICNAEEDAKEAIPYSTIANRKTPLYVVVHYPSLLFSQVEEPSHCGPMCGMKGRLLIFQHQTNRFPPRLLDLNAVRYVEG